LFDTRTRIAGQSRTSVSSESCKLNKSADSAPRS